MSTISSTGGVMWEDDDRSPLRRRPGSTARSVMSRNSSAGSMASFGGGDSDTTTLLGASVLQLDEFEGGGVNFILQQAAIYLAEGENNDKFDTHPSTPKKIKQYLLAHNRTLYLLHLIASVLLLLLAMFEHPYGISIKIPVHNATQSNGHSYKKVRLELDIWVHVLVELVCLVSIGIMLVIKCKWLGLKATVRRPAMVFQIVIMLGMVIEALVTVADNSNNANRIAKVRVMRVFRPIFIITSAYTAGVRRVLRQILQCLYSAYYVLLLLFMFVLLFSICGYFLFYENNRDPNFLTFGTSFKNMLVLITTANFPDIMLPSYDRHSLAALFFVVYLVIGLYFLMNLVLAVLYAEFRRREEQKCKNLYLHRRSALRHAHRLLKDESRGGIPYAKFKGLMMHRNKSLSAVSVRLLFMSLDDSETDSLGLREFYHFYEAEALEWKRAKAKAPANWIPRTAVGRCLAAIHIFSKTLTEKWWFEKIIVCCVILNSIMILVDIQTFSHYYIDPTHNNIDIGTLRHIGRDAIFLSIYWFEAIVRVSATGWAKYWKNNWFRFDLSVTLLCSVVFLLDLTYRGSGALVNWILIFRQFRIIRLFELTNDFKKVIEISLVLFPQLLKFLAAEILIMFSFALVGMEAFSGRVNEGCCGPEYSGYHGNSSAVNISDRDYDDAMNLYFLNNFNDVVHSYLTLFELMVVNNWYVIMDGFAGTYRAQNNLPATVASYFYFMSFWALSVVIVMNVVVAFFLETFLSRMEVDHETEGHMYDTYVKRVVHMRGKLYYKYAKRRLTEFEMQSLEDRWVKFQGMRVQDRFDYQLITFEDQIAKWLMEEEQNLRDASEEGYEDANMSTRGFAEFRRTSSGAVAIGAPKDFRPSTRADSTIQQPMLTEVAGSVPRSFMDGGIQNIGGIRGGGGGGGGIGAGGSMLTRDNVGIMGTSVGRLSSSSYTDPTSFVGTVGGIGARLSPQLGIGVSSSEDDAMDEDRGGRGDDGDAMGMGMERMTNKAVDLPANLDRSSLAQVSLALKQLVRVKEKEDADTDADQSMFSQ